MTQAPTITRDEKTIEHTKTHEQKAEDIAYTINHALSCGATDVFAAPLLAAAWHATTGKEPPKIIQGCLGHDEPGHAHHDHGQHDHAHHEHAHHDHAHHDHGHAPVERPASWFGRLKSRFNFKSFAHHLGEYAKGEILGDFIAVPLTIMVQRMAPNFMHGVRNVVEPIMGGAFRKSAHKAAQDAARKHGLDLDSPEVKAREDAIYEHEVSHLPQAVVWNMFAFPISVVAQAVSGMLGARKHGETYNWKKALPEIMIVKTGGAIISNSVLIGGARLLAPEHANKWDQWQSKTFITPATKVVGKLFGVDEKTVDRIAEKEADARDGKWQKKIEKQADEAEQATEASRA